MLPLCSTQTLNPKPKPAAAASGQPPSGLQPPGDCPLRASHQLLHVVWYMSPRCTRDTLLCRRQDVHRLLAAFSSKQDRAVAAPSLDTSANHHVAGLSHAQALTALPAVRRRGGGRRAAHDF